MKAQVSLLFVVGSLGNLRPGCCFHQTKTRFVPSHARLRLDRGHTSTTSSRTSCGISMRSAQEEPTYLDWLSRKIELSRRPEPVKINRPRLIRDFAVLLMRSSYQV
ncbi:unnamed protein product [Choristocarpus tenellus]